MRTKGALVVAAVLVATTAYAVGPANPSVMMPTIGEKPDSYVPLMPSRVFDSRDTARLGAGKTRSIPVTDLGEVPANGVGAVVMNVTAVAGTRNTYLTVYPTGEDRPLASSMNPRAGQVIGNEIIAKVGAGGRVDLYNNSGTIDVVVDIVGYFPPVNTDPEPCYGGLLLPGECAALEAIYASTDGDNPTFNDGWLDNTVHPCDWRGLSCKNRNTITGMQLYNSLDGTLPPEIGDFTNLTFLGLPENGLTALPAEIGNLTGLTGLYLDGNGLTTLPAEIGNLTSLMDLNVLSNDLTALPAEIGDLTNLGSLIVSHNQLTALPPSLGNLANVWFLDLGNNGLTALPSGIGNLTKLEYLHLQHNQVASLPPEIGQLAKLRYVDLRDNQLTALPAEIGELAKLRSLILIGNQLSGDISPWAKPLSMTDYLELLWLADGPGDNDCLTSGNDAALEMWLAGLDTYWDECDA